MITRLTATIALTTAVWTASATTPADTTPAPAAGPDISELWESPTDLESRDLFNGPWGAAMAPDPRATYRFVAPKRTGVNPGMTVRDPQGRRWKVKQPPPTALRSPEGPIEVVLSRVLSAVGYHQPPVYHVESFLLERKHEVRRVHGGRFRLLHEPLQSVGGWSWMNNPYTNTWEQRGLLVILLMFNSSDLKDGNNTLYEYRAPGSRPRRWYVVRDLGTALGNTGRIAPLRGDPKVFERLGFIRGVEGGYVQFVYGGRHEFLVDRRITPGDVVWASRLLGRLSSRQWHDAFRAGGYRPEVAERFIRKLHAKIAEGLALAGAPPPTAAAMPTSPVIFPQPGENFRPAAPAVPARDDARPDGRAWSPQSPAFGGPTDRHSAASGS